MMAKKNTIRKDMKFLKKTLTVILAGVFLFTSALSSAENSSLAPSSRLNSKEFKTSFTVGSICELIEIKARYGKPLTAVMLEDIAKWKNASDPEFNGCVFNPRLEEGEIVYLQTFWDTSALFKFAT